jgi:hypothetical protein
VTLGLDHNDIFSGLRKYSKFDWDDPHAERWIQKTADSYGKCRLVLENNRYFIESPFRPVVEYYFGLTYLKESFIGNVFQVGKAESDQNCGIHLEAQEEAIMEEDEWQFEDQFEAKEKKKDLIMDQKTDVVSLQSMLLMIVS